MKNVNLKKLWLLFIFLFMLVSGIACGRIDIPGGIADNFSSRTDKTLENKKEVLDGTKELSQDQADDGNSPLTFFDYRKIKTEATTSIGIKIKNINVVQDYFGNLCVFGEILNISNTAKTNMVLTLNFTDKKGVSIYNDKVKIEANYLRPENKIPFEYIFTNSRQYIDIDKVKIGINYNDYYKSLKSNVIVKKENFIYKDDMLKVNGELINLGESTAANISLLSTFYDIRNRVVSIKKCFIRSDSLLPKEKQKFELSVLFSKYGQNFTHYDFEVFFEDAVEMP